jgi:copper(I)-binding protein
MHPAPRRIAHAFNQHSQRSNTMKKIIAFAAAAALSVAASFAAADEIRVGDLVIENPMARATPPNAPVSGGYMTIRNEGGQADRLTGGSADFAGKVEIHEMAMDGDVMKMRELADGLEIPAGGSVELKPGGYHVMFMQLSEQLKDGEKVKATLTFDKAGYVDIELPVMNPGAMKKMNHGG